MEISLTLPLCCMALIFALTTTRASSHNFFELARPYQYTIFPAITHRLSLPLAAGVQHIYYPQVATYHFSANTNNSALTPPVDYGQKLVQLSQLIGSTFRNIGEIAFSEDRAVGNKIQTILQDESRKVDQILVDYQGHLTPASTRQLGSFNLIRRYKRQATSRGADALNSMGQILVNSNTKIDIEKKMLSRSAQRRINMKYKDAVKNCLADSCKAAANILASVEDAEDERQRR